MGLRKFQTTIGLLLIGAILITGCKDSSSDSGDDSNLGSFEYAGESYSLKAGAAFDYGEGTTGFRNFDFVFTEEEENFSSEGDINSGHYMYLWLESLGSESFTSGTYSFDDSNEATTNHIYDGEIALNLSPDGESGDFVLVTGGSVTVERDGGNFEFTFNLTLEDENTVKGSFSADLQIFDNSEEAQKRIGNLKFSERIGRK